MAMFSVVGMRWQEFRNLLVEETMVHGVEHFAVHDFF